MKAMDFKEQLKSTYPYRIELHAHTKPVSPCSEIPPTDLVQAYIDQGFHGVVITNHFNLEYLLGLPKEEALDYYLSGYEEAKKAAAGTGLQAYHTFAEELVPDEAPAAEEEPVVIEE